MTDWVKNVLEIIERTDKPDFIISDEEIKRLVDRYNEFNDFEKGKIDFILKQISSDTAMHSYIISFIFDYLKIDHFKDLLVDYFFDNELNPFVSIMLEYNFIAKDIVNEYELKRKIHNGNVEKIGKRIGLSFPYIEYEKRNAKRIVILTEQLLNVRHAPTKIVLDFAYTIKKYLGYEVLIFACPCDYMIYDYWYNFKLDNSEEVFKNNKIEYEFKDDVLNGYQINMSEHSGSEYHMMLRMIYEFNPIFAFSMGVINSIVDLVNSFTTLVATPMSVGLAVSNADILVKKGNNELISNSQDRFILPYQKIIKNASNPYLINESPRVITRDMLALPNDKILIAIVGNRLDEEISGEFITTMEKIADLDNRLEFGLIGEVNDIKEVIAASTIYNKVHYIGYAKDLYATYGCFDLYLNPDRAGGGISAVIALATGLPVITYPDCDVSENVGETFVVDNETEMLEIIIRYINDPEFYSIMQEKCFTSKKFGTYEDYAEAQKELIENIKETIKNKS